MQIFERALGGVFERAFPMRAGGGGAVADATITVQSSITFRGVTFTFDTAMPTCVDCLGEPCVISTEAFNITGITPDSQTVNSTVASYEGVGARIANGTMINPGDLSAGNAQGFDGLIGMERDATDASETLFSAGLNVDPAIAGPISIAQGAEKSIVKSVRLTGLIDTDAGLWQTIEKYVVLTVLASTPKTGFFRPSMAGTDKTIPVNRREGAINWGVLRTLANVGSTYNQAQAEAAMELTSPYFGLTNGEKLRRFDVEEAGPAASNYSRDFALTRSDALTFLHSTYSQAEKTTTLLRTIKKGIDIAGMVANGFTWDGGAGQGYGRQEFPYIAAFALDDATLLTNAQDHEGSTLNQHFWVDSSRIGFGAKYPFSSSQLYFNGATYLPSDLDVPEWRVDTSDITDDTAAWTMRYREMYPAGMMGALNVALLQNGPGGITGDEAILQSGAFDETNPFAACLAYYDRARPWPAAYRNTDYMGSNGRTAVWDARRASVALTPWTGRPEAVDDANGGSEVTAAAASITYDFSGQTFATEAITSRDIRYSLDGIQWITSTGVAATGTLSSLLRGVQHEVAFRLNSAAGAGRWTPTWPLTGASGADPGRRNVATPTGSTTNAIPANTVAPVIHIKTYAAYAGEEFEPAATPLTEAFMGRTPPELYCPLGYWTGYPGPTFAYQWKRGGVNISGETAQKYQMDWFLDSGATITCTVTATNSEGAVGVTTAGIVVPTEVEPAAPSAFERVSNVDTGYLLRTGGFYNPSNNKTLTVAIKGKLLGDDGATVAFLRQHTTSQPLNIERSTTNTFRMIARNAGGTIIGQVASANIVNVALGEFLILGSMDLATGAAHLYVNGSSSRSGTDVLTNDTINWSATTTLSLLATPTGTGIPNVEIDYIYLTNEYIDLSVAGNRDPFSDATDMSYWGLGPTGNRPLIYAWGAAAEWNDITAPGIGPNKGKGGAFTASVASFVDI